MNDPRLNSVHLEGIRREDFRKARAELLNSVGEATGESVGAPLPAEGLIGDRTLLHSLRKRIPPEYEFVLVEKDQVYPLKIGINTLGRLSDNDVVIPDPYLSRRHCAFVTHMVGSCEVYDVASKNGTYLNGAKIEGRTPLKGGDEIRVCDHTFTFLRKADLDDDNEKPEDRTLAD